MKPVPWKAAAAVIIIAAEMIPPRPIESIVSSLEFGSSLASPHFSCTAEAWRKRFYGTTVVPIKDTARTNPPSGIIETKSPFLIAPKSGLIIIMDRTNIFQF
ncbi:MAG: hypothetical protein QME73_12160 [Bacillota bacterium]|nr:hypothetical protein [Bacillota bacterium]